MTSKLKCPFCGEELEDAGIHSAELYFWCTNCYMKQKEKNDNYTASPRIWQALIQAKQDLEIARKALESISGVRGNIEDYYGGVSIHYQQMVLHMDEIATNALEQITHDNSEKPNSQEHKDI